MALDKAIDRYGILSRLHSAEPSELERFCLRSALLGKLPSGGYDFLTQSSEAL